MRKDLPNGWNWEPLSDICVQVTDGTHESPKPANKGFPLVTGRNIKNGAIDFSECYLISEEDHMEVIRRSKPEEGDVLFSNIGTLGETAVVPKDTEFSIKNVALMKPGLDLDGKYLYYYLRHSQRGGLFDSFKLGSSQRFLSLDILRKLRVPLPSIETQHRIVAILEMAEEIKRLRAKSNELTQKLLQSVFLEMFGDPSNGTSGFPTRIIDDICREVTVGVVVKPASYYRSTGIPAFRSLNIRPNRLVADNVVFFDSKDNDSLLRKSRLNSGDVLVVRTGYPGTACVVPEIYDGANCIDLVILRPKAELVNSHYLSYLINSPYGKAQALAGNTGLAQQHLNVGRLRNFSIPLPPIELQERFSYILKQINEFNQEQEASLGGIESLGQLLMADAFTGELVA